MRTYSLTVCALALAGTAMADPATTSNVHFYEQEKFTVTYELTGSPESGTITEHVMDWGNKRVEIKNVTMNYAGIKRTIKQRIIYNGAEIITVDLQTGAVTKTTNPMHDKIVASISGKTGVEYGKEWATAMGATPTGKTGTYAGVDCDEWSMPGLGTTLCIAKSGITLFNATKMGPVAMTRKATEVKLGDGGPAEAYAYDASKIQATPNIGEIMKKARGGN